MRRVLPALILLAACSLPAAAQPVDRIGPYEYERLYQSDERMEYELTTKRELKIGDKVTRNSARARSQHRVVLRDGIPHEVVEWLTYQELPEGSVRDVSELEPSTVSLRPDGRTDMVKPAGDAAMLGMVTDLVTFYVALGSKSGVAQLHHPGDSAVGEPVTGDWTDGEAFLIGQDNLLVEIELTGLDETHAHFETRFRPATEAALQPYRPWMAKPVCGSTPNNWQMVRRQPNGYLAAWGCEEFTVRSTVQRRTGRIVRATMSNDVVRDVRFCADERLSSCQQAPRMREHRDLQLILAHP